MDEEKFNILKHELVPEHIRLTEEEKEETIKNFNLSLKQFPSIKHNDPAIKVLNAKVGDLIKIKRKSPTTGEAIYYRVVVND